MDNLIFFFILGGVINLLYWFITQGAPKNVTTFTRVLKVLFVITILFSTSWLGTTIIILGEDHGKKS